MPAQFCEYCDKFFATWKAQWDHELTCDGTEDTEES